MAHIVTKSTGLTNGHDGCPPVSPAESSDLVTVNGSGVVCVGDHFEVHSNGDHYPPHSGVVTTGSSIVTINGQAVALVGSVVDGSCPSSHMIVEGDSLVDISG